MPHLRLEISPSNAAELRRDSRSYVPARVREGSRVYANVGIHLKGSTGSFRNLDDKPSLTLNFGKLNPGQEFHGLEKIHLNNSVEDPSFLNERIGSELFRAAGLPAPRVGWATVELNGRRLGLYVLKEGFTEDFLGLHFQSTRGALYEGSGRDVDTLLEKDAGGGPDDQPDLKALAAAAVEANLERRWNELEKVLDMERFVSFMALEVLLAHRDGYCLARNNYRIYHDPTSDRLVFLPHGMDQLFGKVETPAQPQFAGLVAAAVTEVPEGRRRYRERLGALLTNVFDVAALSAGADQWIACLRPALARREAKALEGQVALVKDRLAARRMYLARQLGEPQPQLIAFRDGTVVLTNWAAVDIPAGGRLERGTAPDGRAALGILAGPTTTASWRSKALLPKGRYRFEGAVAAIHIEPLSYGKNRGAGLRVGGRSPTQPHNLVGDKAWTPLRVEFEVASAAEQVELICELRARGGEAWFDLGSLRLTRLP